MADPPTIVVGSLSAVGTVSYNNFVFPAPVKIRIQMQPIYNADGRTLKWNEYRITVETPIVSEAPSGSSTDTVMTALRARLSAPAKNLVITGIGIGTIQIGPSYTADVNYGPKPTILTWEPIGSSQACRLVWSCTAAIRDCNAGTGSNIDFSYSITHTIDEKGYTTRVVNGSLEIAGSRNGTEITATADDNRTTITNAFPPLPQFHRVMSFTVSPDRKHLNFSLTDTQIQSDLPYPPNIVRCSVRHRCGTGLQQGFNMWTNSISGTVEVAPGTSKAEAWRQILLIVAARRIASQSGQVIAPSADGTANKPSGTVIIEHVEIDEDLFGHSISFSVSWRLSVSLETFFQASGLFYQYPAFDWQTWLSSMNEAGVNLPYGKSGLRHARGSDQLIECAQQTIGSDTNSPSTGGNSPDPTAALASEQPTPENSWLYFNCKVRLLQDGNEVCHKVLGQPEVNSGQGSSGLSPTSTGNTQATQGTGQNTRVQVRGESKYQLAIIGSARRAAYKIPPFFANNIAGVTLILRKREYTPWLEKNGGGVPIYRATWYYLYDVVGIPNADLLAGVQTGSIATSNPGAFAQ